MVPNALYSHHNPRRPPCRLPQAVMFSKALLAAAKLVWLAMPYEDSFQTDTCADVNGMTEELTTAVCLFDRLKIAPEPAVWCGQRRYHFPEVLPPLSALPLFVR